MLKPGGNENLDIIRLRSMIELNTTEYKKNHCFSFRLNNNWLVSIQAHPWLEHYSIFDFGNNEIFFLGEIDFPFFTLFIVIVVFIVSPYSLTWFTNYFDNCLCF